MKTSEQTNEISTALAKSQVEMRTIKKESENPFYKSKYADLAAIMEKTQPILAKNGLAIIQGPTFTEATGWILITRISHNSGQWYETSYPLLAKDNSAQAMGSALSYARRYSYGAITGAVAGDEDDDAEGAQDRAKTQPRAQQGPLKAANAALTGAVARKPTALGPTAVTTALDDFPGF